MDANAFPRKGAVPLARFLPGLASEALKRHGFGNYALMANWKEIAGPALAPFAVPVKLVRSRRNFPSRGGADSALDQGAGVLLLRVEPVRALEVQYVLPQLIEKINACLGFRAVSGIRTVQAPFAGKPAVTGKKQPKRTVLEKIAEPGAYGNARLDSALKRYAAAFANRVA